MREKAGHPFECECFLRFVWTNIACRIGIEIIKNACISEKMMLMAILD
jgi:hypothetical protein